MSEDCSVCRQCGQSFCVQQREFCAAQHPNTGVGYGTEDQELDRMGEKSGPYDPLVFQEGCGSAI